MNLSKNPSKQVYLLNEEGRSCCLATIPADSSLVLAMGIYWVAASDARKIAGREVWMPVYNPSVPTDIQEQAKPQVLLSPTIRQPINDKGSEVVEEGVGPAWAKAESTSHLIFDGRFRKYIARLSEGIFLSIGNEQLGAPVLICHCLASRWIFEARWRGERRNYFDLAFADRHRVVSQISLSLDSAVAVSDYLRQLQSQGILLQSVRLELGFRNQQDGIGEVFVVGHEFVSAEETNLAKALVSEANFWQGA